MRDLPQVPHPVLQPTVADVRQHLLTQGAVPGKDKHGVRAPVENQGGCFDEQRVVLHRTEIRHNSEHECTSWNAERIAHLSRTLCPGALGGHVDPVNPRTDWVGAPHRPRGGHLR